MLYLLNSRVWIEEFDFSFEFDPFTFIKLGMFLLIIASLHREKYIYKGAVNVFKDVRGSYSISRETSLQTTSHGKWDRMRHFIYILWILQKLSNIFYPLQQNEQLPKIEHLHLFNWIFVVLQLERKYVLQTD